MDNPDVIGLLDTKGGTGLLGRGAGRTEGPAPEHWGMGSARREIARRVTRRVEGRRQRRGPGPPLGAHGAGQVASGQNGPVSRAWRNCLDNVSVRRTEADSIPESTLETNGRIDFGHQGEKTSGR